MLTSSRWAALLLALTLTTTPLSASAADTYTVQRGDSLSSIAARLLGKADRWREIWSLNPQIRTPKQLQPGTRLRLPNTDSRPEPRQTAAVHHTDALDPIQVMAEDLIRSGHIDRMRTDYRLLDTHAPENRIRLHSRRSEADGDFLYIHGLSNAAADGTMYGLFKSSPEPAGTSFIELTRIGQARLVLQQGDKARLRITENRQPPLANLQVLPLYRQPLKVKPGYPGSPVNARIIKALYEQPGGYLLLLDQGRQSGVEPGQLLHYSKANSPAPTAFPAKRPSQEGGWVLVIDTSQDASLALVIQARQIPAVGDSVR
ncbi:LysM domain-containing protein [Marinobacterium maritimum]|uniref:LysM domain-containing protein n=1 Tax=Marinobacterium maritimum TaxID=500162 RepID=A0ABP3TEK2_9GAMM